MCRFIVDNFLHQRLILIRSEINGDIGIYLPGADAGFKLEEWLII